MKDYYKILGVDEEASEEEIRARWAELSKRYHPDLWKTKEADAKIAEINEAFEVLTDHFKRSGYDFERDLKRSVVKKALRQRERKFDFRKIIAPAGILVLFLIVGIIVLRGFHVGKLPKSGTPNGTDKGLEKKTASPISPGRPESKPSPPSPSVKEALRENEEPARNILPKSEAPVNVQKEIPKEVRKENPQEETSVASAPSPPSFSPAEKESKRKEEPVPQRVVKSESPVRVDKEVPREIAKQVATEISKEAPKEVMPPESKKMTSLSPGLSPSGVERGSEQKKEPTGEIHPGSKEKPTPQVVTKSDIPTLKEVSKGVSKEIPKQVATEAPKEVPKEVTRATLHPGEKMTNWTKEERAVSSPPPLLAKEEEVRQFFSNYTDQYNRKDIGGFLSFFSSKALQNQKEGFMRIKNIYTKFFDESQELRYRVEEMKVEIYQNSIEVKARFRVDQILKRRGEEKVWKGNIRWVLVKEEGSLKISSLDYQNEKSP